MSKKKNKRKTKKSSTSFVVSIILIIIIVCGYFVYKKYFNDKINKDYSNENQIEIDGELSIHILELGNYYAGDCIYIKAGDIDILVDAGSRASSVDSITRYINNYVNDNTLEYVIATHADRDHIAGFASKNGIFDLYDCKTIIDFPLSNSKTDTYESYLLKREAEVENGAKHYSALDCYNNVGEAKREYRLTSSITLSILYNYYYENKSADENNYSVCFMITHGSKNFLFTGDLESEGECELIKYNNLNEVEFYKAGHHGSKTSSTSVFLEKIKPKICCVSCCAGSVEYTQNLSNTFPTQDFINRIAKYTDKVYVTTYVNIKYNGTKYVYDGEYGLLNGNIVVISNIEGVTVNCSNNNTLLKDTKWFNDNRNIPAEWKNVE